MTPRLGINYSLDEARKTQVRASYAMFAVATRCGRRVGRLAGAVLVRLLQRDRSNGNNTAELNEILFNQGNQGYSGFDPRNPRGSTRA